MLEPVVVPEPSCHVWHCFLIEERANDKCLFTDLGFAVHLEEFLHEYLSNLLTDCCWASWFLGLFFYRLISVQ